MSDRPANWGEAYTKRMSSLKSSISFFSLPAELRIKIYKYALIPPGSTYEITICPDQDRSSHRKPVVPALMKTCSTIAYEAAPILYGRNCFKAINSTPFSQWLEAIGSVNIQFLKSVHIIATTFGPVMIGRNKISRPWGGVLRTLRHKATNLRDLSVCWCHEDRGNKIRVRDQLELELTGWQGLNLVIDNSAFPHTYEGQHHVITNVRKSQALLERKLGIPVLLGPVASELMLGKYVG